MREVDGEEEVTMMMGSLENPRNPMTGPIDAPSPTWKLYDNPHYSDRRHNSPHNNNNNHQHSFTYTCLSKTKSRSRSSYHTRDLSSFARPMDRHVNLSDLDNALAEIKELRAELEFERRMRRKVDALNKALAGELAEERRAREAAEGTCRRLMEEIACVRQETERAMKEVEEERRMLQMAEVLREERVQMKLTEARILMEEKIKEMMPGGDQCKQPVVVVGGVNNEVKGKSSAVQITPPATNAGEESSGDGLGRKEVENPHIKRGIKGMEFPRAVRVRGSGMGSSPSSREGRGGHLGSNLECQRAQLRVLMRHKNPASSGLMGAAENLVM